MSQLSLLLKSQTRKDHSFTEQVMEAKALFSEDYTLESYQKHLTHLLKAHMVIDALIKPHKALLANNQLHHTSRVAELKKDLSQLQQSGHLSLDKTESHDMELADLVGLLYVVKGSLLGGQIIGKKLLDHFKRWSLDEKPSFYTLDHSDITHQEWASWCAKIDDLPRNQAFDTKAVSAAKKAFAIFCHPDHYGVFSLEETLTHS